MIFFYFLNFSFITFDVIISKSLSYIKYKVFHLEVSLYNLTSKNEKALVWIGSYDIVDPKRINTTVTNYVSAIIKSLEEKQIINENYKP